jgi:hypothetical protein
MSRCDVHLTCPTCATEIGLDISQMHAEIHPDRPELNRLIYLCPSCEHPQRHDLTADQWAFLRRLTHPGELHEIVLPRGLVSRFTAGLPALTEDDLIAWGLTLAAWETTS